MSSESLNAGSDKASDTTDISNAAAFSVCNLAIAGESSVTLWHGVELDTDARDRRDCPPQWGGGFDQCRMIVQALPTSAPRQVELSHGHPEPYNKYLKWVISVGVL